MTGSFGAELDLDAVLAVKRHAPIADAFVRELTYGALERFSGATYLSRRPIAPGRGMTAPATPFVAMGPVLPQNSTTATQPKE